MKGAVKPKRKRVKICMGAVERFTAPLLTAETLQPKCSKLLPHLVGADGSRQGGFPLMCYCVPATATESSWCHPSPSHMKENGKTAHSATSYISAVHPLMSANRCLYLWESGHVSAFSFSFAGYLCSGLICQQGQPKPATWCFSSDEKRCYALFV